DQRRDQEPLPEVGVAGVDGRRGRGEVDRGARRRRRAGGDGDGEFTRPRRPFEGDDVVAGGGEADRDFGAGGDGEVFGFAAFGRGDARRGRARRLDQVEGDAGGGALRGELLRPGDDVVDQGREAAELRQVRFGRLEGDRRDAPAALGPGGDQRAFRAP